MARTLSLVAAIGCLVSSSLSAQMRITEWQYNGDEFIEFTNLGTTAVDMTGWSYDDDSRTPSGTSLSAFGLVAAGESVILCESTSAAFLANWNLPATVKVIGGNAVNLGRGDEINLFDASNALVDRLTYGDVNFPGSIRTQDISGSPRTLAVGANDVFGWSLAFVGDARGSRRSVAGQVGNPGSYVAIDAKHVNFGAGCLGTGGVAPTLTGTGCPSPNGQSILTVAKGPANAPAVLLLSSSRGSLPFLNCTLYVDPALLVSIPVTLDALGTKSTTLAIPTTVTTGLVPTQAWLVDAGGPFGFTATNGVEISIQ